MWTMQSINEFIQSRLAQHRLIVVANREPYVHRYVEGRVDCMPPVSGMVSALDPILRACGGTWIAHGSGNADRRAADANGRLGVPPGDPLYTLRRVWLTKSQEHGYYNSIANAGLWPLCHSVFARPVFEPQHWPVYRQVNALFAEAVLEEADDEPAFVFVQDFHFGLLSRMIKERNPNLIVAQFWHIPWPNPDVFQVFPWKEELLEGMLGNDLLGFQLRYHCRNFLDTVDRTIEGKVDYERFEAIRGGKSTLVRPFPISIDFEDHAELAASDAVEREMDRWRARLQLTDEMALGIGIDRIDYTKGIPERLRALDRLMDKEPTCRERVQFVQIGVPNRVHVAAYRRLDEEIDRLVDEINWRWSTDNWRPIVYIKRQHSPIEMMALHRLARFCIVSSLDDGMNLVAKEFVASRIDEDGVLILSRFTGAARELVAAQLVNPFAVDEIADSMIQAMEMPEDERRRRMQKMRAVVAEHNVYRWAGKLLSALVNFEFPETSIAEAALASR